MGKKHPPYMLWQRLNSKRPSAVMRIGVPNFTWADLYHSLVTISWLHFLGLVALFYIATNTLFAFAYLAGGDCIKNARPGFFSDAFFFSVQTMATIGYGGMFPRTPYANVVVTVEALLGLVGVAMVTGLAFARFSLPTARVLFSKVAVIAPYNRVPTLMFRTANARGNLIMESQIRVTLVRNEVSLEGEYMRRLHDLKLVRRETPIFALSWTVMHQIDKKSPLYGYTAETLIEDGVEIVVTLTGIDQTVAQTIHSHHVFTGQDILWNMKFVDIFHRTPDGKPWIDYTRFNDVTPG